MSKTRQQLLEEVERLEAQLAEANETLRAIREGEVDAIVVSGPKGEQLYSLVGAESVYRLIVETMKEAAFTVTPDGRILFCNAQFGEMVERPLDQIVGHSMEEFIAPEHRGEVQPLVVVSQKQTVGRRLLFQNAQGALIPAHISSNVIRQPDGLSICIVAADLTTLENSTATLQQLRSHQVALRKSEERYRLLFDRSPDGIFAVDTRGRFILANPACELMSGYSASELLHKTFLQLCAPDQLEQTVAYFDRCLTERGRLQAETALIRKDGRRVELWIAGEPVVTDGKITAVHCTAKDIADRKRAEEALRTSEERLQDALRVSRSFAFEWDPATDLIRRSQSCAPLLGLAGEEATNDLGKCYFQRVHPDDRDRFVAIVNGLTASNNRYETKYRVVKPDGCVTVVEESARGFFAQDGNLSRLVGVTTDVTARELAQEGLRRSETLLRTIIETSEDAIYLKDRDSRVLMANPATLRVVGKPIEQVLGHTDAEFYDDPVAAAAILENDRFVMEAGSAKVVEETVLEQGTRRTYLSSKVPFRDSEGDVVGIIGMSRDITQRKQSEEALREADRRKDEFLAMLAHELRNPLSAISSAMELLKRQDAPVSARERAEAAATRQAAHMAHLLDDLLDVSRVTQGKVSLNRANTSLVTVLESAVEASTPFLNARRHRLYVSYPGESLRVLGDRVRLSQVVGNLLHNSAKYTPAGGEIYLILERQGSEAAILVRDNGHGIDPELLPHVFELFVQGNRSPDRAEGGLGVGLTLVRSLVELHGGRVEVRSKGPGTGSEFRIWLPLLTQAEEERLASESSEKPEQARKFRILVVDDNQDSAELLSVLLEMEGHEVAVANSGPGAVDLALKSAPDFALVDIGMPGMDGYEVARCLRRAPELRDTVLIALTGYGQQEDMQRSRDAGFDHHLVKPVDIGALKRVLMLD